MVQTGGSPMKLGFIGLGQIGAPIAEHWLSWPGGLVVCDIRADATAPFAEKGAEVAADPATVVEAGADLISVMVLDDQQVRTVVGELVQAAAPGTIVAVHSTIRPETAEELAARALHHDVLLLDAPVSGGAMGAAKAALAVMVGGDEQAFERAVDPFGSFAQLVVHVGPAGAATRTKIARNLISFVGYAAAGEAARLAEAAGIDLGKLGQVVRHSDAIMGGPGMILLRPTTAPMTADDGLLPVFTHTADLGKKDLALALELGEALGVELPLAEVASADLAKALGVADEPIRDGGSR
jgi:3-hydroxyisobutyrate dehydrogenase-like beta-hydroxyacid dehydrogenase